MAKFEIVGHMSRGKCLFILDLRTAVSSVAALNILAISFIFLPQIQSQIIF